MFRLLLTSRPVLAAETAGLGIGLGFYYGLKPDKAVPGLIATTAGAVFAVTAGAGIPLLYGVADRRLEHWRDARFGGGDTTGAREDLADLVTSLRVVLLGIGCLLLSVLLSLGVAYENSVAGTGPRAVVAASFALLAAGLLLTLAFAVDVARIPVIERLSKVLSAPAARPRQTAPATRNDVDRLVGSATPHFALQLRARVEELVRDLPADDPVRRYGEGWMAFLDRLARTSSKEGVTP